MKLSNRRGVEVFNVMLYAFIALFLLVFFTLLISDNVRGSVLNFVGLGPTESAQGTTRCNNACDTSKMQVMSCEPEDSSWQINYCQVKYNNSLSCSAAEAQKVISRCEHKIGNSDCVCI